MKLLSFLQLTNLCFALGCSCSWSWAWPTLSSSPQLTFLSRLPLVMDENENENENETNHDNHTQVAEIPTSSMQKQIAKAGEIDLQRWSSCPCSCHIQSPVQQLQLQRRVSPASATVRKAPKEELAIGGTNLSLDQVIQARAHAHEALKQPGPELQATGQLDEKITQTRERPNSNEEIKRAQLTTGKPFQANNKSKTALTDSCEPKAGLKSDVDNQIFGELANKLNFPCFP